MPTIEVRTAECSMDGCERPVHARTLCMTHYMRVRRHGDPSASQYAREHPATCSVPDCDRPYRAKGLCHMHWQRQRATGDTGPAQPLVARYDADAQCSVSGCDRRPRRNWLCEMHADRLDDSGDVGGPDPRKRPAGSGHIRLDGYIAVPCPAGHPLGRDGRTLLHRLILWDHIGLGPHRCHWCSRAINWTHGLTDTALVVDHLDHDPTNNDPANLVGSCHPCNSGRVRR